MEKILNKTVQCAKCPWKQDTNPYEIPNGYSPGKHKALAKTCQSGTDGVGAAEFPAMACHETQNDFCVGWLYNQMGEGNNIALRLRMRTYKPFKLTVIGKQHKTFAETLPTKKHLKEFKLKSKT